MLEDFVYRYAGMLTGRDVNRLFGHLRKRTSRSEAARLCDLERRTTYYWSDDSEVRLSTKRRVLQAVLEKDFEYAVEYLCERSVNASIEAIGLYLGTLYEKATDPDIESVQFQKLCREFRAAVIKYSPVINSTLNSGVSQMFENLRRRSQESGFDLQPLPMSALDVKEVVNKLPRLLRILPRSMSNSDLVSFSRRLNVSQDFLEFASGLKGEIAPTPAFRRNHLGDTSDSVRVMEFKHVGKGNIESSAISPQGSTDTIATRYVPQGM